MEPAFQFIANTEDGVFVVDRQQRIVLWNDGARALLGFDAAEALGANCYELFGGSSPAGCPLCRQGCCAKPGGVVPTLDVEMSTKSGTRWVSVTTVAFPAGRRELPLLAHMVRDASGRRELEASCEQLLRRLARRKSNGDPVPMDHVFSARSLTGRELQVLRLLAVGSSTSAIGERLRIGKTTVRTHVQRILEKLDSHSRLEAVVVGQRHGLI